MTNHFHIRWNDTNSDGNGHFQGKKYSGDDWDPLSECAIEPGSNYEFFFEASTGRDSASRYTTYITFCMGEATSEPTSWSGGAKVAPGDNTKLTGVEITTDTTELTFRAWKMISDDPKVKVNWSDGNQGSKSVRLTWDGSSWEYALGDEATSSPLPSDDTVSLEVQSGHSATISAQDTDTSSSTRSEHRAGFYDIGHDGHAKVSTEIEVHALPLPPASASTSYRSDDEALTYKAVNLFHALDSDGTLTVSSTS